MPRRDTWPRRTGDSLEHAGGSKGTTHTSKRAPKSIWRWPLWAKVQRRHRTHQRTYKNPPSLVIKASSSSAVQTVHIFPMPPATLVFSRRFPLARIPLRRIEYATFVVDYFQIPRPLTPLPHKNLDIRYHLHAPGRSKTLASCGPLYSTSPGWWGRSKR